MPAPHAYIWKPQPQRSTVRVAVVDNPETSDPEALMEARRLMFRRAYAQAHLQFTQVSPAVLTFTATDTHHLRDTVAGLFPEGDPVVIRLFTGHLDPEEAVIRWVRNRSDAQLVRDAAPPVPN